MNKYNEEFGLEMPRKGMTILGKIFFILLAVMVSAMLWLLVDTIVWYTSGWNI